MGMELHALLRRMVLALLHLALREAVHEEHVLILIRIEAHGTAHTHGHALLELAEHSLELFLVAVLAALRLEELLAADAVRRIGDAEGQELRARLELDGLDARARPLADRAFEDDVLRLALQLVDGPDLARHATAEDEIARSRQHHGLVQLTHRCFFRRRSGRLRRRLPASLRFRLRRRLFLRGDFLPQGAAVLRRVQRIRRICLLHLRQRLGTGLTADVAVIAQQLLHDALEALQRI